MSERIFATQGEVLEFLHSLSLKIGRSKLSADYRSGRLKCTSDKQFREEDVLAYAESLKAPATQKKPIRPKSSKPNWPGRRRCSPLFWRPCRMIVP